ncbi:MAG: hypothetical protein Q6361_08065 [Candidatus Hermodarchaeota archaeon]|nr:hypothetical protein [Candidatus Hermodarchaeota archaeon]
MKLDFEKLYADLTDDEREDLDGFRRQVMHFRWFTDSCETWEDLIGALLAQVQQIRELQAKGATIIDTDSDRLYYLLPGESPVYATLTGKSDEEFTFTLSDGTEIVTPLSEWADLQDEPIGRHLILFINAEGEVLGFVLAHNSEDFKSYPNLD